MKELSLPVSLKGEDLYRWSFLCKLALAFGWCLDLYDYLYLDGSHLLRLFQDLLVFQKKGSQIVPSFRLNVGQILGQQLLRYVNINCLVGCNCKPCWLPYQKIWRCALSESCKNCGFRCVYKLPSWRYQWVWQCLNRALICFFPAHVFSGHFGMCGKPECCPSGSMTRK